MNVQPRRRCARASHALITLLQHRRAHPFVIRLLTLNIAPVLTTFELHVHALLPPGRHTLRSFLHTCQTALRDHRAPLCPCAPARRCAPAPSRAPYKAVQSRACEQTAQQIRSGLHLSPREIRLRTVHGMNHLMPPRKRETRYARGLVSMYIYPSCILLRLHRCRVHRYSHLTCCMSQ